jgi:hypothetical protein
LWVFHYRTLEDFADEPEAFDTLYLVTDRSKIAKLLVRDEVDSAKSLRAHMRQIHWYQSVYNACLFEGWDESDKHHLSMDDVANYQTALCAV